MGELERKVESAEIINNKNISRELVDKYKIIKNKLVTEFRLNIKFLIYLHLNLSDFMGCMLFYYKLLIVLTFKLKTLKSIYI